MKKIRNLRFYLLVVLPTLLLLMGLILSLLTQSEMVRLQMADPKSDLQLAIQRKDLRFIGMGGLGGSVPGDSLSYELAQIKGVKYVPGTGDDSRHLLYAYLFDRVRSYAERYNSLLSRHILQSESSNKGRSKQK